MNIIQQYNNLLNQSSTLVWLKKRSTDKDSYTTPAQKFEIVKMRKVYNYFKQTMSNNLVRFDYLENIFHQYGFVFNRRLLNDFFTILDQDRSKTLDWEEFLMGNRNLQAIKIFKTLIAELKSRVELNFIPETFSQLLQYIAYQSSRDRMRKNIISKDQLILEKFEKCKLLLTLENPNSKFSSFKQNENEEAMRMTTMTNASPIKHKHVEKRSESFKSVKTFEFKLVNNQKKNEIGAFLTERSRSQSKRPLDIKGSLITQENWSKSRRRLF